MNVSEEEMAAILAALQVIRQAPETGTQDRWMLAACLDQEPDPWWGSGNEAYSKLHP